MANTLYWHDYESFGTDAVRDRPVQFAGIRTDEELNIIGEPLNIYARLTPDVLPQPGSTLVTGITPQDAMEKGLCEDEFIGRILEELAKPGTCGVGYNSIRFDDEMTRNTLYRNLYDPYAREWQNGNSRWDIIDLVRACRDLRPDGINWPVNEENGRTSFKLDELTVANGIEHEHAHDALADVYATIAIARLIKEKQPKLYDFVYKLRRKQEVNKYIDLREMSPILHTSGMYGSDHGNTRLVIPLAMHPVNKNSVIVFDLSQDPKMLLELGHNKLRERLYTRNDELPEGVDRPALKQLIMNKCPVLAPLTTLDGTSTKRLQIDLVQCQQNRQAVLAARKTIQEKIHKIFQPQEFEPKTDTDLMIYGGGFFSDGDKRTMQRIHDTAPQELAAQSWVFDDKRLPEMLFRFRARNYPETLSEAEQAQWQEFCRTRLSNAEGGFLGFDAFFAEIERIKNEETLDERGVKLLVEVEAYGKELQQKLSA